MKIKRRLKDEIISVSDKLFSVSMNILGNSDDTLDAIQETLNTL